MIVYPAFAAAVAETGVDELAAASGVPPAEIRAIALGGWAAPREHRAQLAAALDADPVELFRARSVGPDWDVDLEPALAAAPTRFVTDPETLRNVHRSGRAG